MGWLEAVESAPSFSARNAWDNRWWSTQETYRSVAGVDVGPEGALTLSAVWGATKVITGDMSSLSCITYQRRSTGKGRDRAVTHPNYELLRYQPNHSQTAVEFWEMMTGHLLLRGNGYAKIEENQRTGAAEQLVPRHPDRMTPERLSSGRVRYKYDPPGSAVPVFYTEDEIMHLKGFSSDGLKGISVIEYAAHSLGTAIAADHHAGRFFGEGATPSAVLSHPGVLGPEGQRNLRESVHEYTAGVENTHGYLVLEENMQWHQIGIKPEEAQLLATREFGIEEVARWFNIPVHKLRANKEAQTFASVEAFNGEYVTHTLRPLAIRIEQAIRRDLIAQKAKYFVEFLLTELLRANAKERGEFYHQGIMDGWLSRQEARESENRNPGPPELDEFLEPLNMVPAGSQRAEPAPAPAPAPARRATRAMVQLATDAATKAVLKEKHTVLEASKKFASEPDGWAKWVDGYYSRHKGRLRQTLGVTPDFADEYCQAHAGVLVQEGVVAMDRWGGDGLASDILGEEVRP